ncbi:MAG: hypothetical protein KF886_02530 [Candidatus Hydrogenedentes bacterium]|nr:hypothetical protein [Candidatus Hydrogenedentota bacterium]
MSNERLVIGMPAGSLADPNRGGNLIALLKNAGFPTRGYDSGGPTKFPLNAVLMGWDGRPQEFGAQLAIEEIDIAIAGDDWIQERVLEFKYEYKKEINLEKVLSLNRGGVRLVTILNPLPAGVSFDDWLAKLLAEKPLVSMVAEMPYLALDWFHKKIEKLGFAESHGAFSVQKFKTPPRIDRGLVIYETWGKTEAKVVNGSVDFGLEITQTGSAIRNYGLQIGEDVFNSETGIWANPAIRENPEKAELARMFLLNLKGSIYAEDKVLLFFNVKNALVEAVLKFLGENALFADEPTMNPGDGYTEFSVQVSTTNKTMGLAAVRYELAKMGATHIETVPLDSCITSLDALNF